MITIMTYALSNSHGVLTHNCYCLCFSNSQEVYTHDNYYDCLCLLTHNCNSNKTCIHMITIMTVML